LSFFSSNRRLPTGFIFPQDSAPAHTARSARNWLRANCPNFIRKDQRSLNSPIANSVDYRVWSLFNVCNVGAYRKLKTKPKTISELKESLQVIWSNLPQGHIDKTVKDLKLSDWRLVLELGDVRGHFEHSQWQWNFGIWSLVNCVVWLVSTMLLNWCCSLNIFSRWKIGKRSC